MSLAKKFMKQKMMRQVLISLIPVSLMSIYLFGWRMLLLLAFVTVAGVLSEYGVMYLIQKDKTKVSEAVFVSCLLYTLTLPPSTPIWIAVVGIVFAIVFAKGAFGGFGQNIFNPALVARCFVYISFPNQLTVSWTEAFQGFPGGFAHFAGGADLATSATPMIMLNDGAEGVPSVWNMFLGTTSGSLGETSALLILLGAVYLLYKKTASWKIMLGTFLGGGVLGSILYFAGVYPADPLQFILSGGFLFAAVFMATDPITASRDETGKFIFGVFVGLVATVIRVFSLFTEGIMFAVLIGNAFAPLIDRHIKSFRAWRKAKREEVTA
ncbi:MAG TPA: RnfABCDGE type electron transport complex subunit D [Fastidiosipila sp.]|nr:RnfABCDGE type electron transport complex subunit D [Fastidiosipila sp.]